MGKRLSKIVTRTGDDGTTGLTDGSRIGKHALRMEAMGTVDELNAFVGLLLSSGDLGGRGDLRDAFSRVQNDLFDLGGELSMPGHAIITAAHADRLEVLVEALNEELEPLTNFILPGGAEPVARCHVVRTVARRAERLLVALAAEQSVNAESRKYLNRLSDLAFVGARVIAKALGEPDVLWQQQTEPRQA